MVAAHRQIADQVTSALQAGRVAILCVDMADRSVRLLAGACDAELPRVSIEDGLTALFGSVESIVGADHGDGARRISCSIAGMSARCTVSPADGATRWVVIEPEAEAEPGPPAHQPEPNSAFDADWRVSPDLARLDLLSESWAAIAGRPARSTLESREEVLSLVHPDDRAAFVDAVYRLEEPRSLEHRVVRPDRNIRWVHSWLVPVRGPDGEVLWVGATSRDLTDQRFAEEALRESEERLRLITDNTREVFWISDPAFRRLYFVSPAFEEIWGAKVAAAYKDPEAMIRRIHVEDREKVRQAIGRAATGRSAEIEFRLTRSTGVVRWLRMRAFPVRDLKSRVYRLTGIVENVTSRRRMEEALAAAEAHYRRLVEQSPYGIFALDTENRFTEVNPALARIFGREVDAVLGRAATDFLIPDDHQKVRHAESWGSEPAVVQGGEFTVVLPDGTERIVHVHASAIAEDGTVVGTHGVARDVTEEIARERQLRRAERMASLGTLLSGVAHELNNPLTSIKSFAQLMLMDEHTPDDREALDMMQREANRAAKIVADLRMIARESQDSERERQKEPIDLNEVVRHVIKLRRYALDTHNILVQENLVEGLPAVWGDRGKLEQVVINLLVNAEHALNALSEDTRAEKRVIVRTRRSSKGVSLALIDNGGGILPEYVDRIFDPFWTTKKPGEGTGLGLSLIHTIVTEHGGEIRVDSEPGQGAAFTVDLPRAAMDVPAQRISSTPARIREDVEPQTRRLHILVVDDEPSIRRTLVRFLTRSGHTVAEAEEGEAALRMLDEAPADASFDVIVSDLRMPGLSGDRLLRRLEARGDGSHRSVVFMTGDSASGEAAAILADADAPVVLKPFELSEIAGVIERHARR